MNSLDGIKERLLTMPEGETVAIHHSVLVSALQENAEQWMEMAMAKPTAETAIAQMLTWPKFSDWCEARGFVYESPPVSDYCVFRRAP